MMIFISKNKLIVVVSTAVFLLLWELAAHIINKEILVPPLSLILDELYTIVTHLESLFIVATTLGRILLTFLLSLILAVSLGIPAGLWTSLEMALKPLEIATRSVPTMGIILLAIIWLGSEGTPLFVTALIIFPLLYRGLIDGIHNIDVSLTIFHQVHHVPFFKQLIHFYLPSILPSLKTGCVSGLGLGFKVMIAAEVLSQPQRAIGTTFQIERSQLNTAGVMAWCIVLIVIAALFEALLQRVGKPERKPL
jgi:NitT/TauT family transport system permease protein